MFPCTPCLRPPIDGGEAFSGAIRPAFSGAVAAFYQGD
jgi:hypothetical protein